MPKTNLRKKRLTYLAVYGALLVIVGLILTTKPNPEPNPTLASADLISAKEQIGILDRVSSLMIAGAVAQMTDLENKSEVINNYTLLATQESLNVKPTVLPVALEERVKKYTVKEGDTTLAIANQFGVTENSVIWSNQSASLDLTPGSVILVPATTGIVYMVKPGETPALLANRFKADIAQLTTYNDAEIDGFQPNQQIVIPNGVLPANERLRTKALFSTIGQPVIAPTAKIKAGDLIGYVGDTGYSFGAHLHLEARLNGEIIDPNPYIDSGTWRTPVSGPISQPFNNPSFLYANGFHSGTDYDSGDGSPVRAVADGVLYRGCASAVLGAQYGNGLGYMAVLDHGNGLQSIYAHMTAGPDGFACRN